MNDKSRVVRVGVIDIDLGNVSSVVNMIRTLDSVAVSLCSSPSNAAAQDLLVLPGVGAFDNGVERLKTSGWFEHLQHREPTEQWVFGICLGMQLLCEYSEEGTKDGLGLIPGGFQRLQPYPRSGGAKVPHMGWNSINVIKPQSPLAAGIKEGARFYFVHSYHYVPADAPCVIATTTHGGPVVAAVQVDSAMGVQFHPEKSHHFGRSLFAGVLDQIFQ